MRHTQIMGYSEGAVKFLRENEKLVKTKCNCPDCKTEHVNHTVIEEYFDARDHGMFADGPMLDKQLLKDGSWVYEYVQVDPWSSGPCIFLALSRTPQSHDESVKIDPIPESLWDQRQIDNC